MEFIIIGAGSVGGYIGAKLQLSGNKVTFIVKDKRKEQLDREGLRVITPSGSITLSVDARTSVNEINTCDVCIVSVRNYNLEEITNHLMFLANKNAKIISLLNGIEHISKIVNMVGKDKIIGGSFYGDLRLNERGEIVHRSGVPRITLGELAHSFNNFIKKVADVFMDAGIKTSVVTDLMRAIWLKYMFVLAGSFTAVAECSIGEITSMPIGAESLRLILEDVFKVATLSGVNISSADVEETYNEITTQDTGWTSLVYEDLKFGRRTEIDALWGYLVKNAEKVGYEAKVSKLCYSILKLKEAKKERH